MAAFWTAKTTIWAFYLASTTKLTGTWSEAPSYSPSSDAGDFEFDMSEDCASFSGSWKYGSEGGWYGSWTGTRI